MDFFVSDLHLSDLSLESDNFRLHVNDFFKFVKYVKNVQGTLWCVGDFGSFWEYGFEKVMIGYRTLASKIRDIKLIPGNHDQIITDLADSLIWDIQSEQIILERGDNRFFITHGHQYDRFNKEGSSVGRIVSELWEYGEKFGLRDVLPWIQKVLNLNLDALDNKVAEDAQNNNCNYVIKGHDHIVGKRFSKAIKGVTIFDCGTWTIKYQQGFPFILIDDAGNPYREWFKGEA